LSLEGPDSPTVEAFEQVGRLFAVTEAAERKPLHVGT
jgi:hypothetical protein